MRSIKFFILFIVMAACFTSAGSANVYDTEEELQEALEIYDNMTSGLDIITSCCDTEAQKIQFYSFWEFYVNNGTGLIDYESNCVAGLQWYHDDFDDKYYLYPYISVLWVPFNCVLANNGNMDKVGGYYYFSEISGTYPSGTAIYYTLDYQYNPSSDSYVPTISDFTFNLTQHNLTDGFMIFFESDEHFMWYGGNVLMRYQENIVLSPKTFFYEYQLLEFEQDMFYEDKETLVDYLNDGILKDAYDYVEMNFIYKDGSSNLVKFLYSDDYAPRTYVVTEYTNNLNYLDYSNFYKNDRLIAYADNDVYYDPEWEPDDEGYERYLDLINQLVPVIPPDELNDDYFNILSLSSPFTVRVINNYVNIGTVMADQVFFNKYNCKYIIVPCQYFDTFYELDILHDDFVEELNNVDVVIVMRNTDYYDLFGTEAKRTNMRNNAFGDYDQLPQKYSSAIEDYGLPVYYIGNKWSFTSSAYVETYAYMTEHFRQRLNSWILFDGFSVIRDYLADNAGYTNAMNSSVVNGFASVYLNIDTLGGKIDQSNIHLKSIRDLLTNIKTNISNILDEMRSESERELPEHGIFTPWLNFIKRLIGTYTPGAFINDFENYEMPEDLLPEVTPTIEDNEEDIPDAAYKIPIREGPYYA